jgi:hypothetical protein
VRQLGWGQLLGPGDLGGADADPEHLKAIVAGKDAGTAADAAAHIEDPAASRQQIKAAPVRQLMHEIGFGLAEIPPSGWISVEAQVDVVPPKPLQQLVFRPAVVGGGHAGAALILPTLAQPKPRGQKQQQRQQQGRRRQQEGWQSGGQGHLLSPRAPPGSASRLSSSSSRSRKVS